MHRLWIGVDAGGTFTDFVVLKRDGELSSFKLRSNPSDPAQVILEGLERATGGAPAIVIHGSTVATNALVERKGASTAFVTTQGFEDLIRIGRQNRRELYNLTPPEQPPLVARELCFGVRERTYHDGAIAVRPSAAGLRRLKAALRRAGVESVAVCLLHSYRNAENEQRVAEALAGAGYVCCSHEISPEFREYERAGTTVINAYVAPLMDAYLAELEKERRHRISILQSNGGFMSAAEARRHAVRTVLSGPAGGVVGACEAARACGFRRVLGFDMGGTSTDVSLSIGRPRETTDAFIDGFPIRVPMLDIHTVGAGGGSIARVDAGGRLRVGPESAGAHPGPACYGIGIEPTVTDAHVVLGRIAAGQFLGGEMRIDVERSAVAMDRLAGRLHCDRIAAAQGVLEVANANMQRAIRAISVERGYDPSDFALVAFGGCGGLHAAEMAEDMGIGAVVVPREAGVLSALGMLLADRVRDYAAGALGRRDFERLFRALEKRALRESPGARLERAADLRYAGQSYELTVPWRAKDPAAPFHEEHRRTYGYSHPDTPVEVVTIRVRARTPSLRRRLRPPAVTPAPPQPPRRIYVGGRWRAVPVYWRSHLTGDKRSGPALVLDYGATTLVPPGWQYHLDPSGALILRLAAARGNASPARASNSK